MKQPTVGLYESRVLTWFNPYELHKTAISCIDFLLIFRWKSHSTCKVHLRRLGLGICSEIAGGC